MTDSKTSTLTEESEDRRLGAIWGTAIGILLISALFLAYCDDAPDDAPSGSLLGGGALAAGVELSAVDFPPGAGFTVEDGVVTLTGEVDSEATKTRLESEALAVPGVTSVVNQLTVRTSDDADGSGAGGDGSDGDGTSDDVARTEQPEVQVSIVDGVVTLRGVVGSRQQADALVAVSEQSFGSGNVVDELTISEAVIEEAWVGGVGEFIRFAEVESIDFEVTNGVAVLRGETASEEIKTNIGELAAEALPGFEIRNELTVVATEDEVAEEAQEELDEALELENITFETGSAQITAQGQVILDQVAEVLTTFVQIEVEIQGHTDSQGSAAGNLDLSQRRADAVLAYLVDKGIAADRMTAVGYGEDVPIADNGTAEGRAQNRRIGFIVQ
jgi:outer membrane protein OmpA-like peptidoglycan-associated protein